MSNLGLPDNRPAVAWLMELPPDWVTPTERLLLLALALDSFDGYTCAPGRDGLMRLAGIKYVSTFTRARDALTQPTEYRPALIVADIVKGRHTRYQLLRPVRESQTGGVRESQTGQGDLSAEPVRESQTGSPDADLSAEPVRETCPRNLSAEPVRESQTHPPSSSRPEGGRDEEGEALSAPPRQGAARTRLPDGMEPLIFQTLRERWDGETPVVSNRARTLLAELLDNGWTPQAVLAGVSAIGKKPRNPGLLLEAHLKRMRDEATPDDYGPAGQATPAVPSTRRDPLAEENQKAVATFCKWAGADRQALSAALADIEAAGYTVGGSLALDNYSQVYVDLPDECGESWQVYWEAFTGDDFGERVTHNELRATFQDLPLTQTDLQALATLGKVEDGPWVSVAAHLPDVATFRRFVEVTGPIARAATQRAAELPQNRPKPKPTPTPRAAAEVLAGDTRDPGPNGFGTVAAPTKVRAPGFDQAVREADDAERHRQTEALARLTTQEDT